MVLNEDFSSRIEKTSVVNTSSVLKSGIKVRSANSRHAIVSDFASGKSIGENRGSACEMCVQKLCKLDDGTRHLVCKVCPTPLQLLLSNVEKTS